MASRSTITFNTFRGCDFTNAGTDMDADKSPNCINMIRDVPGKIRKRMGYHLDSEYSGRINGYHYLANTETACIHAGTDFYNLGGIAKSVYFSSYNGAYTGEDQERLNIYASDEEIDEEDLDEFPNAFCAVGTSGYMSGKYDKMVSGNAITNMRAICYGAGRFVAVGDSGKAFYSTDKGKTWEKMSGLDTKSYYGVTYDETQEVFLAVGAGTIRACRDGVHWYDPTNGTSVNYTWYGVAGIPKIDGSYGAHVKEALIVGNKAYAIYTKGETEKDDSIKVFTDTSVNRAVVCVPIKATTAYFPLFVVVGDSTKAWYRFRKVNSPSSSITGVLTNGLTSSNYYGITWNRNVEKPQIVACGTSGIVSKMVYDELAKFAGTIGTNKTWTAVSKPKNETYNLSGIACNGETYVLVTSNGALTYSSQDLETWEKRTVTYNYMQGVYAPVKEGKENFKKATIYFEDKSNVTVLPVYSKDNLVRFDVSNYDVKIKSAISNFFIDVTKSATVAKVVTDTDSSYEKTIAVSSENLYTGANNERSVSLPFNNKLYILDGKEILQYDGYSIVPICDIAYIPTLTISKEPTGGGTDYEALNLVQPGFTEQFICTASTTKFQMTFGELDSTEVKAWVLNSNAEWVRKYEGTDFSVDRITGIITFTSAVGATPVSGEDNVKITAYRTVEDYADRINKCRVGCLFGVNGAQDRIFVGGNPDKDYLNYDWYSQRLDATYFGDTSYCTLGNSSSSIVGYAIINNYLAAFKGKGELHQNVLIREGNLVDDEPAFPLINTLQGDPAVCSYSFRYVESEPLFLTEAGIMAITSQDITSEKYTQVRSFYLNGKLLKEDKEDLKDAYAILYNDMYLLAVNGNLYVLDSIQPMQTDKSLPYATRQYAGFYCTNIPARVLWVDEDNTLFFGTDEGKVYKFYTDEEMQESYHDDGKAIEAIYETPDLDGKVFFKNKTFKYLSVRLGAMARTSLAIYAQVRGLWSFIKKSENGANYISFDQMDFSKFTFKTDKTQKIISTKLRIKKVDKTRIRLVNDELNEGFYLCDVGLEYVENNNYKG